MPARDVILRFVHELIKSILDWYTCNSAFVSANSSTCTCVPVAMWFDLKGVSNFIPQHERRTKALYKHTPKFVQIVLNSLIVCYACQGSDFSCIHCSSASAAASTSLSPAFLFPLYDERWFAWLVIH